MDLVTVVSVVPWVIVGLGCWIGYHLVRQNGRIILRLEALEAPLAQLRAAPARSQQAAPSQPEGLPVGAVAPAFDLPDLAGTRQTLTQWRGQRLVLIFFNPRCGFCQEMAPALAALPIDGAQGRPVPLLITSGNGEATRALVEEHGLGCPVLCQAEQEVASAYRAHGTPTGYLIDDKGLIASPLAVGAEALLALADARAPAGLDSVGRNGKGKAGPGIRPLTESRIKRDWLGVGTVAPTFTLPRLGGGELALADYRGQRVLVVFSDPHCGPCDNLSPHLEQYQQRLPDLQILMISRGETEGNLQKVRQHGLTFPVGLQRSWEISRLYAKFGTPIGYLIDEDGHIAADAAVGIEPILELCARSMAPTNGSEAKMVAVRSA